MRNNDHRDDRLANALEELQQRSPLNTNPLDQSQSERICQMALQKLRSEHTGHAQESIPFRGQQRAAHKDRRRVGRSLRIGLVAAALLCVSSISVYAVGVKLLPMLAENIGFFENAPSRHQVDNPAQAPRGEHGSQQMVEVFNTAVGTSVENSGITLTLDNVSMDIAGVDAFFTVQGQQVIEKLIAENDYMPLWDVLGSGTFFDAKLNGLDMQYAAQSNDWYQTEDGALKVMVHFLMPQLPEGEQLNLQISSSLLMKQEGNWSFDVALDGASVRSGGKVGEAGTHALPKEVDEAVGEINMDLDLAYLAFGPRGGVMMTNNNYWEQQEENGVPLYSGYDHSTPDRFMITDSTGKVLFVTNSMAYSYDEDDRFIADLTLPDPAATSVTLTPMKWMGYEHTENLTFTTQQLKEGVKIPCGPESGYYIKDFVQEGSSFRWELEPYGYGPNTLELIPNDAEMITMTNGHSGLISSVVDPRTGTYSCRLDYYVATPEEVASIQEWSVPVGGYQPDHAHAITIPLSDLPAEG